MPFRSINYHTVVYSEIFNHIYNSQSKIESISIKTNTFNFTLTENLKDFSV